jgi:tellurite resistance protein TerC
LDLGAITIILQLIFLEGVLSIDNAAVLGAMVAHLPNNQPVPWPPRLQFLAGWSARTLGAQRQAALKVGLLGAYVGRALMLLLAGLIIDVPWVRITGAIYLLYLAIEHFGEIYRHENHGAHALEEAPRVKGGFWATVALIELADLAFSVDNVIAAVALSNELWVVMLGVAIGIVIMRFAAQIFTRMIAWEPAMASGAYLLLLAIGAQLLVHEFFNVHLEEFSQFLVSIGILALTIGFARVRFLRPLLMLARPLLAVAAAISWVVEALKQLLTLPFRRNNSSREINEPIDRGL